MAFKLRSSAFEHEKPIPAAYTGEGKDISPPLSWSGVPAGTESIALICDDSDAPVGTFVHWVVYNIPPGSRGLDEGVPGDDVLPDGTKQGRNDFGRTGYGGPHPPPGKVHRYCFKIYCLDNKLEADPGITKAELLDLMQGHIIANDELIGTYER